MKKNRIKVTGYLLLVCFCLTIVYGIGEMVRSHRGSTVESVQETLTREESEPSWGETEESTMAETESPDETTKPGEENGQTLPVIWERWNGENQEDPGGDVWEEEEGDKLPSVIIASDLHLLAKEQMDGGKTFQDRMEKDDGKTAAYSGEIIEAFLTEVIRKKPDVLVLSGDLSFEGDKLSHQVLAGMLKPVQEEGIQILIMPGNHDINNHKAASYFSDEEEIPAESVTPVEFEEIYHTYGFDQAISRDESSLSYLYPLREDIWLMLLDTNKYDPVNEVEGDIRPETYQWMIQELDRAREEGAQVIPIGHHNLLQESRLYTRECVIVSHSSALWLFREHHLPLYLSGHLHAQRFKKHKTEPGVPEDAYGIHEIVTSSLGMSPHQYGVITWDEEGRIHYQAERVDVEAWAESIGSLDENLLHFEQYSREWFYRIVGTQVYKKTGNFPEEDRWAMALLYADILYRYGAGDAIEKQEVKQLETYRYWERFMGDDRLFEEMNQMLDDASQSPE